MALPSFQAAFRVLKGIGNNNNHDNNITTTTCPQRSKEATIKEFQENDPTWPESPNSCSSVESNSPASSALFISRSPSNATEVESLTLQPETETKSNVPHLLPPTPPATPPSSSFAIMNNNNNNAASSNGKGNSLTCDACGKTFTSKSKMAEHVKYRHSNLRPHSCTQCPKVFKSSSNLRQHIKCAHERPRFKCVEPECEAKEKLFSESGLRYHRLTHHDRSARLHECSKCHKKFAQASLLKKHVVSAHSGERRFPCPYCPAAFKRKDHADRHVADTHTLVAELFECDLCGGRFQSASRLKQHCKLHGDAAGLRQPCTFCGKRMLVKNLVTHYNRAHALLSNIRVNMDADVDSQLGDNPMVYHGDQSLLHYPSKTRTTIEHHHVCHGHLVQPPLLHIDGHVKHPDTQ